MSTWFSSAPASPPDPRNHDGPWSAHYDSGRLSHVFEVPLLACVLWKRSAARVAALEVETGIPFTTSLASLTVMPSAPRREDGRIDRAWFERDALLSNAADLGIPPRTLGPLAASLAFHTFGATVTLLEVAGPDAVDLPATMYLKTTSTNPYGGIIAPPVRYPDGR